MELLIQVEKKKVWQRFYPPPLVPFFSLLSAIVLSTRDGVFSQLYEPKAILRVFSNGDKNMFGCVGVNRSFRQDPGEEMQ